MLDLEKVWSFAAPFVKTISIFIIGHFIIVYVMKLVKKGFNKSKLDASLIKYCLKAINFVLHMFVILAALDALGVSTGSIIAATSAAVVAIGVALKDSLSNVAGGLWLLFSPRFQTGDYIEAEGDEGIVTSVELLHTTLLSNDSKQISIPNGVLINSHITNYTKEQKRRVDITFTIPYEADVKKAKKLAFDTIMKHEKTLCEPDEPFVRVSGYGESSVNLSTKTWCKTEDYWTLYYDIMENVREAFEQNDISIPYNHLDVHIKNN